MWNRFITQYRNLSQPVKASLWFVICNVVSRGVSFFTMPIFSRLLSTAEYGIVTTYSSWCALVSIITTLTLWGGVFSIAMVKYRGSHATVISSFQGLAISITSVFFLGSVVILDILSGLTGMSKFLICCMYIEIMATIPFYLWSSKQRFYYKYRGLVLISLIIAIANPVLGMIAVNSSAHKAEAKIFAGLIINVVIGITFFIINQCKGKTFFHRKYWKYAFNFNVVLIPHYLSMQVLNQSDRIMINKMCGNSDAGLYGVAYNFGMLLQLLTSAVESSLTPYILRSIESRNTKNVAKNVNLMVFLFALITMAVICLIPDVFMFMLPKNYYDAMWTIPPITAGIFFVFIYPLFGTVELYYEKKKYLAYASVITASVNIITNYIYIKQYGYVAAAYTTLGCYMLLCIVHYLFMRKVLKQNKASQYLFDERFLFIICLGVVAFSIGIVFLYKRVIIRWVIIVITGIVFACNGKKLKDILKPADEI